MRKNTNARPGAGPCSVCRRIEPYALMALVKGKGRRPKWVCVACSERWSRLGIPIT